jgi:hypothetical protein
MRENDMTSLRVLAVAAVLLGAGTAVASAPAAAQEYGRTYEGWQSSWDRFEFDRHHVILGTVQKFEPFRVTVLRRDGDLQTIDLKNGTVILPTGATPTPGNRIAIVGYYSRGTFIANRLILHG